MGCLGLDHVAWVTVDPVSESGRIWDALSGLHSQTGLMPIQVDGCASFVFPRWQGLPAMRCVPGNLSPRTEDPREADALDVGALLENRWRDGRPDEHDPGWSREVGAVHPGCPGSGCGGTHADDPGRAGAGPGRGAAADRQAHGATPEARIGLVAAEACRHVLAVIGWGGLDNTGNPCCR